MAHSTVIITGKTQRTSLPSSVDKRQPHRARQEAPFCAVPAFFPVFFVRLRVQISEVEFADTFLQTSR